MDDRIKVAVRIRPLIEREVQGGFPLRWSVENNQIGPTPKSSLDKKSATYTYDHVFGLECQNRTVYEESVAQIVKSAMLGYNGTIFAYGQTSSGKTYTIMGEETEEWGVIPYAVQEIFHTINSSPEREYLLRVSYVELYKEELLDLLSGKKEPAIKIREKQSGEVFMEGIKEEIVKDSNQILDLLIGGQDSRHVGETNMNERSSRSHTIFRIVIESRELQENENVDSAVTVSQLNIVDLAGSERNSQSGATGERLKEGVKINLSLSTLARVISQLSENEDHVSFRDSNLTRILKNSLGGNARTLVICTVTPADDTQTHSTLKFASRAKRIKNKPIKNEILTDEALLKRYQKERDQYRNEIDKLKQQLEHARSQAGIEELQTQNEALYGEIESYKEKMSLLQKLVLIGSEEEVVKEKPKSQSTKSRRQTWCPGLLSRPLSLGTPSRVRSLANIPPSEFKEMRQPPLSSPFDVMSGPDLERELVEAEMEKQAEFHSDDSDQVEGSPEREAVRRPPPSDSVSESPGSVAVPKKRSRIVGFASKLETVLEKRASDDGILKTLESADAEAQTDEMTEAVSREFREQATEVSALESLESDQSREQDCGELREKLEACEAEQVELLEELSKAKLDRMSLVEERDRLVEEAQLHTENIQAYRKKDEDYGELQFKVSDSLATVDTLSGTIDGLKSTAETLERKLDEISAERSKEADDLHSQLALARAELGTRDGEIREMSDKLAGLEDARNEDAEKIHSLAEDMAAAQRSAEEQAEEHRRKETDLTQTVSTLQKELADTKKEFLENESKFAELEEEVRGWREKSRLWTMDDTKDTSKFVDKCAQAEYSCLDESGNTSLGVEQKLKEMREQILALEAEKVELVKQIQEGVDPEIQAEIVRICTENASLKNRVASLSTEVEELRRKEEEREDGLTPTGSEEADGGIFGDMTLKSQMLDGDCEWTMLSQSAPDSRDESRGDVSLVAACRPAFTKDTSVQAIEAPEREEKSVGVEMVRESGEDVESMRTELEELEKGKDEAVGLCERLITERDELTLVIKDLQETKDTLSTELSEARQKWEWTRQHLDQKDLSYVELQSFHSNELAVMEDAREENITLREKCLKLEEELELLNQKVFAVGDEDFRENYDSMKKTTEDAEGMTKAVSEELAKMQSVLKEEEEKYRRLKQENVDILEENGKWKKRVENAERDVEDYAWMLEDTKKKNTEEKGALRKRVAELEGDRPGSEETPTQTTEEAHEMDTLKTALAEKESELQQALKKMAGDGKEIQELSETSEKKEAMISALNKEIERRDEDLGRKEKELEDLSSRMDSDSVEWKAERETLLKQHQAEVLSLQTERGRMIEEAAETKRELEAAKEGSHSLTSAYQALMAEKAMLEVKMSELEKVDEKAVSEERKRAELEARVEELSSQLSTSQSQDAELRHRLEESLRHLDNAKAEENEQRREVERLSEALEKKQVLISDLEKDGDAVHSELSSARLVLVELESRKTECLEMKGRVEELSDQLSASQAERLESEEVLKTQIHELECERTSLEEEKEKVRQELGGVRSELVGLTERAEKVQADKDNLHRELEEVKEGMRSAGETERALRTRIADLERDLTGKTDPSDELKKARSDLAGNLIRMEHMESAVINYHEAKMKLGEKETELAKALEDADLLREKQRELQLEASKVASLQEEVEQLREESLVEVSKEQLIQSEQAMEEKTQEIHHLEAQMREVEQRLETFKESAHEEELLRLDTMRTLNGELEELKEKAGLSQTHLQEKERMIAETTRLREEVEKLRKVEALLRKSKRRLEGECDKADAMEENYQKEIKDKELIIAQLQGKMKSVGELEGSVKRLEEEMRKRDSDLEAANKGQDEQRVLLMRDGMRAADLERQLSQHTKDKAKEIHVLKKELEHREERIRNLKNELRCAQEQGADSTVRIQRASSEAAIASKRAEEKISRGMTSVESATGSGIVDALVVHGEKQKAYEARKLLKEKEKKIKELEAKVESLQGENMEIRETSFSESRKNLNSSSLSLNENSASEGLRKGAVGGSLRKKEGFRIPTPIRSSSRKKPPKDETGLKTPVQKLKRGGVLSESQSGNRGELKEREGETPKAERAPKSTNSPASCRQS